jgi:hypothetical protein
MYYVCSIVWWMFAFLYDVCLPILCLATCDNDVWFPVWYNALVPVSSYLYDVCLPIWCLPICVMSAYLYDVCLPIWCLPICVMSAYLYNVCLPIWWLPICVMSAYLYDVCLPVWHLLKMMSAYLYCVLLIVWRLFNCMMYVQRCDVFTSVWYLFNYMYDVRLPVCCLLNCTLWFLPECMISSYPYDVCSTVPQNKIYRYSTALKMVNKFFCHLFLLPFPFLLRP